MFGGTYPGQAYPAFGFANVLVGPSNLEELIAFDLHVCRAVAWTASVHRTDGCALGVVRTVLLPEER